MKVNGTAVEPNMHYKIDPEGNRVAFSYGKKAATIEDAIAQAKSQFDVKEDISESNTSKLPARGKDLLKSIIYEDGRRNDYNYNFDKNTRRYIFTVTEGNGNVTESFYSNDSSDPTVIEIFINGNRVHKLTRLDNYRTQTENEAGVKVVTTKDQFGRITQLAYADNTTEQWFYNNDDRLLKTINREGMITDYVYGELTETTISAQGTPQQTTMVSVLNRLGMPTQLTIQSTTAPIISYQYEYDEFGNLIPVGCWVVKRAASVVSNTVNRGVR